MDSYYIQVSKPDIMKWAFVIVLLCILKPSDFQSQNAEYHHLNDYFLYPASSWQEPVDLHGFIYINVLDKSKFEINYKTIVDLVSIGLLIISTFFVVVTPLIFLFFWVYYSIMYVKKFRYIFSIKKWLSNKSRLSEHHLDKELWRRYRKVYTNMLGFGIAIIAYTLFAVKFMSANFDRMEFALAEYLSYPFKVLGDLKTIRLNSPATVQFDYLWDEMFIIVILSFVFYLIGWLLGSLVVDYRLKSNRSQLNISKKSELKKEMFYLKLNKEIEKKMS